MAEKRERIVTRLIEDEMRESFIDYSMSVIVQRALPDVRDGLKPVHRRILHSMRGLGLFPERPYKKSATVVGDVLGKYHPHGDVAVYDALVRMVQDFSLRSPLVDGQGNFGSVDGDSAAAYRYTEVKLSAIAVELLGDLDQATVDFTPNFDNRLEEPVVLPARFPNLLVNGSSGIAVGMSTNVPPHNLREIAAGVKQLVIDPDCTVADLMRHIPGPDFPTGGFIVGAEGIADMYRTGRGRVVMRARIVKERLRGGRDQLVVTELPYATNKTKIVEQIAGLARKGRLDDVSDIRDESDRDGIRLVVELKRGASARQTLGVLYPSHQPARDVRRDSAGTGRGRTARVRSEKPFGAFPGSSLGSDRAAVPVPAGAGRGRKARGRGPAGSAQTHRRGHPDHSWLARPTRCGGAAAGPLRAVRCPRPTPSSTCGWANSPGSNAASSSVDSPSWPVRSGSCAPC